MPKRPSNLTSDIQSDTTDANLTSDTTDSNLTSDVQSDTTDANLTSDTTNTDSQPSTAYQVGQTVDTSSGPAIIIRIDPNGETWARTSSGLVTSWC